MWVKIYKDSWFPVYDIAPSNAKNHDAVAIINYQRYLRWKRGFRRFKKLQAEIKAAIAASNQPPPAG